ncbi:MAG: phage terminase large subunit [Acidobacteriota bacterium]
MKRTGVHRTSLPTSMKNAQIPQSSIIKQARELWLKYGGKHHERITSELRARGLPFYRSMLYTRRHSHGVTIGWPERFGWRSDLTAAQRAELGNRNGGRHAFESWLKRTFPKWDWTAAYQRYIYNDLAELTQGRSRRLMIFMPPRHGKSETVTIRYTAWRLLQDPTLNVILGSYNQRLADRFSRRIKRIVAENSPPCLGAVPEGRGGSSEERPVHKRLAAASEWETPGGGIVRSVGVGAGIAGFGAGLIVIDDPVRNRADAESKTYRDRVWDWFNDDIYTRLEPDAAIVLIQTRWHEDDLAGRLLRETENGGEPWEVVSLPAIAQENEEYRISNVEYKKSEEIVSNVSRSFPLSSHSSIDIRNSKFSSDPLGRSPGEALCPRRYPIETLERIRKKLGSYSFAALYQQAPTPAEGGMFRRAWFEKIVESAPEHLRWKRGYDLAISTKTSADQTASFRCAYDHLGNLYIADGFCARIEYPEQRRYIIERMQSEKRTEHGIEKAAHGEACHQDLRREPQLRQYPLRLVPVKHDKLTRALAWLNLAEEGKVFLVRGPWIPGFIDEIARFPNGRHDDQIDAVSLAVQMLAKRSGRLICF